jgi:hypothetical protein
VVAVENHEEAKHRAQAPHHHPGLGRNLDHLFFFFFWGGGSKLCVFIFL